MREGTGHSSDSAEGMTVELVLRGEGVFVSSAFSVFSEEASPSPLLAGLSPEPPVESKGAAGDFVLATKDLAGVEGLEVLPCPWADLERTGEVSGLGDLGALAGNSGLARVLTVGLVVA